MSLVDTVSSIREPIELETYLAKNSLNVHDYFNRPYEDLLKSKRKVREYVLRNYSLRSLNLSNLANVAYLEQLLKYCERFGLSSAFSLLLRLLQSSGANIGKRLEAAALFLIDLKDYKNFLDNYQEIVEKLQIALQLEEDDDTDVVVTFVNYYNKVIRDCDTNIEIIERLREKISDTISQDTYIFMSHELILNALLVDYHNPVKAVSEIQKLLEKYLSKESVKFVPNENELLIEENTPYTSQLEKTGKRFDEIRGISTAAYRNIENANTVFASLRRGVSILHEEAQMYSYMAGFGNMHKAKMASALEHLPESFFQNDIEIFDWACGQAIATMVYLDILQEHRISQEVKRVTLIEPSEICIKRAAAHIKAINSSIALRTINKPFDDLVAHDVSSKSVRVKLHLFSNILDVELFDLPNLINLISTTQRGVNYFACVSPSITDVKIYRIERFVNFFRENSKKFEMLAEEHNSPNGVYWNCNYHYKCNQLHPHHGMLGCSEKWKRLLKVFMVKM